MRFATAMIACEKAKGFKNMKLVQSLRLITQAAGLLVVLPTSVAWAADFSTVYSFQGNTDGSEPTAPLVAVAGVLYGTTVAGGGAANAGVVYQITPSGTESVLHSFGGTGDGKSPYGGLINNSGVLFGTTYEGGASGAGTVFRLTTAGEEQVLKSFDSGPEGQNPITGLTFYKGAIYGSNYYDDGSTNYGTLFKFTGLKYSHLLYTFGYPTGAYPFAPLVGWNGLLYGTTYSHGANGGGIAFSITPDGAETVLHSFGAGNDGASPIAGLVNVAGNFYGSTHNGGTGGCGTIYRLTPAGIETVLYNFTCGPDGAYPIGTLANVDGVLYGVAQGGGGANSSGVVFSVTLAGSETVLHSFSGYADGDRPTSSLVYFRGSLWGTTVGGGTYQNGTVFHINP